MQKIKKSDKMKIKTIHLIFTILFLGLISCAKDSLNNASNTTGKGGSMARFTIVGDFLYIIDNQNLKVFDIATPSNPQYLNDYFVGRSIETIFPNPPYLYIGSTSGMYIYSIANPAAPEYISELLHVVSCDPVVTNDSLAFVTLRSGSECRTNFTSNQLDIIDIRNKQNPVLLQSYPVEEPYGLGIDSCYLFICHGKSGLGVYDFSNVFDIHMIKLIPNIETYDVIPHNKTLFITGPSGFYQYNYANIDSIYFVSQINVFNRF